MEESSDGSHLVEYNHLSFTNMARDDEGAIAVYGLSPGSVVRDNLIHDVKPATTNENVGLFLQNMASGWSLTNNILYGLKQAEMKLCAAYLENNVYRDNHMIERPQIEPEKSSMVNPVTVTVNFRRFHRKVQKPVQHWRSRQLSPTVVRLEMVRFHFTLMGKLQRVSYFQLLQK